MSAAEAVPGALKDSFSHSHLRKARSSFWFRSARRRPCRPHAMMTDSRYHAWHSLVPQHLKDLNPETVMSRDTSFHRLMRR